MKLTNFDKRQNAVDLLCEINRCATVDECEMLSDKIEELANFEQIFNKDYYALTKKLDSRRCYLTEKGYI